MTPTFMTANEALQFFRAMKILPYEKIVRFDFSMVPDDADIVYNIPDDETDYGGRLEISKEQQYMILAFFGVDKFYVNCLNVASYNEQDVFVDVTIQPETRK